MSMKLFVLGCSGSGKSTAARFIAMRARDKGCPATHINDYGFLYEMFLADTKTGGKKFRPAKYGGFDVLDFTVYDEALMQLEEEVYFFCSQVNGLIIIEFARDDYSKALKLFNPDFLQDAYFLLLSSTPDICLHRIHKRAIHPTTLDDHFVPEYIVETCHQADNRLYITTGLKTDFAIDDQQITVIDNIGSQKKFGESLEQYFLKTVLPELPIPSGVV